MSFSTVVYHERKDGQKVEIAGDCITYGRTLCPGTSETCPLRRIKDKIENDAGIAMPRVREILREEKDQRHVTWTDFRDVPPFAIMVECSDQWYLHDSIPRIPVRKGVMLIYYRS